MKKAIALVLCVGLLLGVCSVGFADSVDKRVMLGADNGEAAIDKIYNYFRINRGDVEEIPVTNAEERQYLAGLVPDRKIGSVALSSAYIDTSTNNGIEIESYNIDWVTPEMYRNALATAGIENARVIVAAANPVSGTGALAGIYKAYEDITGEELDQEAKDAAAEELVVTGDLQEQIGEQASGIITDLKGKLAETKDMNDEQIQDLITDTAKGYDVVLNSEQIQQILDLLKKLQGLNININIFEGIANGNGGSGGGFLEAIGNFFKSIGDFFRNLFGGGNKDETPESSPSATVAPEATPDPGTAPPVSEPPVSAQPSTSESTAVASSAAPAESVPAASDQPMDEGLPSPDPETANVVYTGEIKAVDTAENTVTLARFSTDSSEVNTIVGLPTENCIFIDGSTGKQLVLSDLKDGQHVKAYFGMQSTFSEPPQSPLYALITDFDKQNNIEYVVPQEIRSGLNGQFGVLSQNGDMELWIPTDLEIQTPDGKTAALSDIKVGSRLIAWTGPVREIYPAQADAIRVILFPETGPAISEQDVSDSPDEAAQ